MNIEYRKFDKKVVTPSNKSRLLTKWNEDDPISEFEAVEKVKYPLSKPDTEILNEWHEITKQRANKLYEEKNGPAAAEEQPVVEEPAEPKTE